jgi:hypothetical protein
MGIFSLHEAVFSPNNTLTVRANGHIVRLLRSHQQTAQRRGTALMQKTHAHQMHNRRPWIVVYDKR